MFPPFPNASGTALRSNAQHIYTTTPLIDPISNKIPELAMTRIFQYYVDLHCEQGDLPTFGFDKIPASAPLTLGAVCRSWRYMAWNNPALWTNLVVDLMSEGHQHGPALVKEWLERTADLPINVALRRLDYVNGDYPPSIRGRQRKDAEAVVNILNLYWSKLKSIDLRDVPWDLCVMISGYYTPQPLLTNLCIGGHGSNNLLLDDAYPMFRGAPHKQAPTGLSLLATIPFQLINIDWSKITTLHLEEMTRQAAFTAMSLCAETLTTATLESIDDDSWGMDDIDDDDFWIPEGILTLPALATFSFAEHRSEETFSETLYDHITAPALKTLVYTGDSEPYMPMSSIIGFIKRSGCTITKLGIHEADIQEPDSLVHGFVPLLHTIPHLHTLDLVVSKTTSVAALIDALGQRDPQTDRPAFLPHLRKFSCTCALTFNWALFPKIWIATHPMGYGIDALQFMFSEVRTVQDRVNLSVDLTLRGPALMDGYVAGDALLALMNVQSQIMGTITVHREDGRLTPRNFYLEASFLHCFPTHLSDNMGLYYIAKMIGIF